MIHLKANCCEKGKEKIWFDDTRSGQWIYDEDNGMRGEAINFCPFCGKNLYDNIFVDLSEFEKQVTAWQDKNFGKHFPMNVVERLIWVLNELEISGNISPNVIRSISISIDELKQAVGYRNLLGAVEEIGELSHAQLKGEQGIRHTSEEILHKKKDAVGDTIVYLINYCNSQKFTLTECINLAWSEVKDRNWNNNNITGR